MSRDIHNTEKSFNRIKNLIKELPSDANGKILKQYLELHEEKLNRNKMSFSSVTRSLEIAYALCDSIPNVSLLEATPLERYWSDLTKRKIKKKLPTGKIIELDKHFTEASLEKHRSQIIKLYKFVTFLKYGRELSLFNAKSMGRPEACTFLFIDKSKKRKDFPIIEQKVVGDLIKELTNSPYYYARMAGVLVALANDFGGRFSELIDLKKEDIRVEDNYLVVHIRESKTAERYVVCYLAAPVLKNWVASLPKSKDNYLFPSVSKEKVSYNSLRLYLVDAAKKVGLELPNGKSFHLFRHLCSTRLTEMPSLLKRYWMGWELGGMDAVYSHPDYKQCKKYYFESIKGSPLLDKPLSFLDKEEKKVNESLEIRVKALEKLLEVAAKGENVEEFVRNKINKV